MHHLFFISFLKSREKEIADSTDFERMINAESDEEMARVLHDTDYGPYVSSSSSFDEIFKEEKKENRALIERMGISSRVKELIFLPADVFNMRVSLKNKMFGADLSFNSFGEKEKELRKKYADIFEKAEKLKDPAEVDDMLTKFMFERMEKLSKEDTLLFRFLGDYKEKVLSLEKEEELIKREDAFLEEAKRKNEGLSPVFAHFMMKNRAEKVLRTISESRKTGAPKERVYKMIKNVRAL